MQDFNDYANSNDTSAPQDLLSLVTQLANKYDGKSQNELLMAIYQEAKKGKQNGTLTNEQLDGFASVLSPFLDDKKKSILKKIMVELKKI